MQAEIIKAAGMQHKQTGDTTPLPTDVPGVSFLEPQTAKAVDPQLVKLRAALDEGAVGGGMTWMLMA